jgi:hypothetical protein
MSAFEIAEYVHSNFANASNEKIEELKVLVRSYLYDPKPIRISRWSVNSNEREVCFAVTETWHGMNGPDYYVIFKKGHDEMYYSDGIDQIDVPLQRLDSEC